MFRIDVELFFLGGLALLQNFFFFPNSLLHFFFFFKILVQNLFGIKILRVCLIFLEDVPIFFFKGKQIKNFKLLYIIFFFKSWCSWEYLGL